MCAVKSQLRLIVIHNPHDTVTIAAKTSAVNLPARLGSRAASTTVPKISSLWKLEPTVSQSEVLAVCVRCGRQMSSTSRHNVMFPGCALPLARCLPLARPSLRQPWRTSRRRWSRSSPPRARPPSYRQPGSPPCSPCSWVHTPSSPQLDIQQGHADTRLVLPGPRWWEQQVSTATTPSTVGFPGISLTDCAGGCNSWVHVASRTTSINAEQWWYSMHAWTSGRSFMRSVWRIDLAEDFPTAAAPPDSPPGGAQGEQPLQ